MKMLAILMFSMIAFSNPSLAQETQSDSSLEQVRKEAELKPTEHLLDGTSMNYFYQNGSGIHIEFHNGMLKYEWIVGPRKGNKNQDLIYSSRKVGHRIYLVSWLEASHPDYTTLLFNFDNNVMFSSGDLLPKNWTGESWKILV